MSPRSPDSTISFSFCDARVVEQQVAGHEHQTSLLRELAQLLHLVGAHRRWLLDEDVLARLECAARELVVRRHRRRDHDRLDGVVREQVVETRGHVRCGVALREAHPQLFVQVADPGELGSWSKLRARFLPHWPRPT